MRNLIPLITFLIVGCNPAKDGLSSAEKQLVLDLGFDEQLMTRVRESGDSFEPLMGMSEDFEPIRVDGLILLTGPRSGRSALQQVRSALDGSQYAAYLNDDGFGFDSDKVAVIKSVDEYAYLAMVRTDGINYDIEHEQVLAKYREWDEQFELALIGAGLDWLEAEFGVPPNDWMAFAQELYQFCPDIVDQGTGSVGALATQMRATNTLYLWWD